MAAELFRILVPVDSIDNAATFYSRVLDDNGVRVSDGRHYFQCGGSILACYDPQADGDEHRLPPLPVHIYIAVDDLPTTLQRVTGAGGTLCDQSLANEPMGEIAERPWGERSFYAFDPFGNPLCFVDAATKFTGSS